MRFLLLSKADIQGNINLNNLLPLLTATHEVRVLLSDFLLPAERGHRLANYITYHDRDFILNKFFPLVDHLHKQNALQPDVRLHTFDALSRTYQLSVQIIPHQTWKSFLEREILTYRPHIILSCRHDYILTSTMLNGAQYGAYNMHSGPLPAYRGPQAPFWAMYNHLEKTACTLHRMITKIDAGNIIAQPEVPLDYSHSVFWNRLQIYQEGINAFSRLLPELQKYPLPGTPQDQSRKGYFGVPTPQELEQFESRGHQLVNYKEYEELLLQYLPKGYPSSRTGYTPYSEVF